MFFYYCTISLVKLPIYMIKYNPSNEIYFITQKSFTSKSYYENALHNKLNGSDCDYLLLPFVPNGNLIIQGRSKEKYNFKFCIAPLDITR